MNRLRNLVGFALSVVLLSPCMAAYQEVEWIKASTKELVMTDYVPASTDRIEMKFSNPDPSSTQALWCSRESNINNNTYSCFFIASSTAGSKYIRYDYGAAASAASGVISANTDYVVVMDGYKGEAFLDDEKIGTFATKNFTVGSCLAFFASNPSGQPVSASMTLGNPSHMKVYYCKVYDSDNNLKLDLVPARDLEAANNAYNRCGFYDKVSGKFYPNVKTGGKFTCGEDVIIEGIASVEDLELVETDGAYSITGTLTGANAKVGYRLAREGGEDVVFIPEEDTTADSEFTLTILSEHVQLNPVWTVYCFVRNSVVENEWLVGKIITGTPDGYVTWICQEDSVDKKASNPDNWSGGAVPQDGDKILFDGDFSLADCEWDLDVALAEWRQVQRYTGKITVKTTYGNDFPKLRISGNMLLEGGSITHLANNEEAVYRLNIEVGGNLRIGKYGMMDAREKGYGKGCAAPDGVRGLHGGSRGTSYTPVYGNVYEPEALGSGGSSLAGGGAIKLMVTGNAEVNGTIRADCPENDDAWSANWSGAGGSVYITAKSLTGSGTISVSAPRYQGGDGANISSGGRIAITLTEATSLGMNIDGIQAFGSLARGTNSTGAGTVVVKTANQTYGTLYVRNVTRGEEGTWGIMLPHVYGTTVVPPGAEWTFDAINFAGAGVLSVPTGATLRLVNGFASVTGSSYRAGLLYLGGTIDTGDENPHILQGGKWVFAAEVPFTFNHDVTVRDEAAIGQIRLYSSPSDFRTSTITVNGNLDVESSGRIYARGAGIGHTLPAPSLFTTFYAHGGLPAIGGMDAACVYGSALNPSMPGTFGKNGDSNFQIPGGGCLKLTVSGNLNIDGQAIATGGTDKGSYYAGGSGGSLNITAGSLTGSGIISTDGHSPSKDVSLIKTWEDFNRLGNQSCGGGGRLAIRLTDRNAKIPPFNFYAPNGGLQIRSLGGVYTEAESWRDKVATSTNTMASAGTVYLQNGDEAEGCGTIYVNNRMSDNNNNNNLYAWTPFPAGMNGDTAASLRGASLSISGYGRMAISQNLSMNRLEMDATSLLNLCGNRLVVKRMTVNGVKKSVGTYTAENLSDVLVGEGELIVGGGMAFIIK